jgi:hypothetical protein
MRRSQNDVLSFDFDLDLVMVVPFWNDGVTR